MNMKMGIERIFLSSTDADDFSKQLRAAAKDVIEREYGDYCVPVDMSDFPATSHPPDKVIKDEIQKSRVFVGVIGALYGAPTREDPSKSYVEFEFDTSKENDLEMMVYLLDENEHLGTITNLLEFIYHNSEKLKKQHEFRKAILDSDISISNVTSDTFINKFRQDLNRLYKEPIWISIPPKAASPPARIAANLSRHFTGRKEIIQRLSSIIEKGQSTELIPIWAGSGVGKTQIVLALACELKEKEFAEVFWVHLPGNYHDLIDILIEWARFCGRAYDRTRIEPDELADEIKDLIAKRRKQARWGKIFVVIDDLREGPEMLAAAQLLLKAVPKGIPILVTTRNITLVRQLGAADRTFSQLNDLTEEEALTLMTKHLGKDVVKPGEVNKVKDLLGCLGYRARSIELAASYINTWTEMSVDPIAQLLEEIKNHSIELFDISYEHISEKDSRRLFRWLSVFEQRQIYAVDIAGIMELEIDAVIKLLLPLVNSSLVHWDKTTRSCSLHPSSYEYSLRKLAEAEETSKATSSFHQYFLEVAKTPSREFSLDRPRRETVFANIGAVIDTIFEQCKSQPTTIGNAIDALQNASVFLDRYGYWKRRVKLSEQAVDLTKSAIETIDFGVYDKPEVEIYEAQAWVFIYHYGWSLLLDKEYEKAQKAFDEGLQIAERYNLTAHQAMALRNKAVVAFETEQALEKALEFCMRSLVLWNKCTQEAARINPDEGQALTLGTLGNICVAMSKYVEADSHYANQLYRYEQLANLHGQSVAATNLALVSALQGRVDETRQYCQQALKTFVAIGRPDGAGYICYMWSIFSQPGKPVVHSETKRMFLDDLEGFKSYDMQFKCDEEVCDMLEREATKRIQSHG
jgi:tetratricopeptide (TPR) repeat protein